MQTSDFLLECHELYRVEKITEVHSHPALAHVDPMSDFRAHWGCNPDKFQPGRSGRSGEDVHFAAPASRALHRSTTCGMPWSWPVAARWSGGSGRISIKPVCAFAPWVQLPTNWLSFRRDWPMPPSLSRQSTSGTRLQEQPSSSVPEDTSGLSRTPNFVAITNPRCFRAYWPADLTFVNAGFVDP
jgi:hypothetical protein